MDWVRERTIPTEWPPLVGEVITNFYGYRVPRGQRDGSLLPYSRFSRHEPLLFYQVAPQLYSRGWVDPVPDPLLFFLLPGNRTRDPWICSQELWPLDHRGGQTTKAIEKKKHLFHILPLPPWALHNYNCVFLASLTQAKKFFCLCCKPPVGEMGNNSNAYQHPYVTSSKNFRVKYV
jgi:hypothetical protein